MPSPEEIIPQIAAWRSAKTIEIQPQPGGKTNRNYLILVDGERFVLRICTENTAALGIRRATECAAISAAASIHIAPEVIAFLLPEGHLVTRFIDGVEWSPEDFKQPDVIIRVAAALKQVHALPPVASEFDPYLDIEQRLEIAAERGIPRPARLDELLQHLYEIRARRIQSLAGKLALCHNDPWYNNFLDDGSVRLLDWEFAGMGDPYFDLASAAAIYSAEQKQAFLQAYWGSAGPSAMEALEQMIDVVMFWNATWAMIQIGTGSPEIDYVGMVQHSFQFLEAHL